jgi:hypothetical protein
MSKRITEFDAITAIEESDVMPIVDVGDPTQASSGSTKKGTITKLADFLKDRTETLTNKTLTSPVVSSPEISSPDITGGTIDEASITGGSIDGADISGGTVASDTNVIEVLKKVYPVGSVYINASVATNPGSLLGFGTWEAFGAGRVMVGKDASGTFDTAGATGGVETVTLTSTQSGLVAHTHTVVGGFGSGGASYYNIAHGDVSNVLSGVIGSASNNTAASASEAHTNLQPYIVVYAWKRTV